MKWLVKMMRELAISLIAVLVFTGQTWAQTQIPDVLRSAGTPPKLSANAWVLMESKTAWVVNSHNAHERVDPASLTKLMTAFLVFEALSEDKLSANDSVAISKTAWQSPGSRMFLKVDTFATIGELINGLVIQSGNDAAVALAEHLAGTEDQFAQRMNDKAKQLGMNNSHYINASGLPHAAHHTTAYDTALLSREIIERFPDMYSLFAIREYTYNKITQPNRNGLLWRDSSYDGLKTGYTKDAGYCLAGSATRGNTRFVAVVMGAESKKEREQGVAALVNYGFTHYETATVMGKGVAVKSLPLYKGNEKMASVSSATPISVVLPRAQSQALQLNYLLPDNLVAPLQEKLVVGEVELSFKDQPLGKVALHPVKDYPVGPLWSQILDAIKLKIFY